MGEALVPAPGREPTLILNYPDLLTPREGQVLVMEGERPEFESSSATS